MASDPREKQFLFYAPGEPFPRRPRGIMITHNSGQCSESSAYTLINMNFFWSISLYGNAMPKVMLWGSCISQVWHDKIRMEVCIMHSCIWLLLIWIVCDATPIFSNTASSICIPLCRVLQAAPCPMMCGCSGRVSYECLHNRTMEPTRSMGYCMSTALQIWTQKHATG